MKVLAFKRYLFHGQMWLPLENVGGGPPILTFIKMINFDFAGDPSAPRSVIISIEPFPQSTIITSVVDQFGVQPLPGAEYTVTTVEPLLNFVGQRDVYRHQAALRAPLDFGYEGIERP